MLDQYFSGITSKKNCHGNSMPTILIILNYIVVHVSVSGADSNRLSLFILL